MKKFKFVSTVLLVYQIAAILLLGWNKVKVDPLCRYFCSHKYTFDWTVVEPISWLLWCLIVPVVFIIFALWWDDIKRVFVRKPQNKRNPTVIKQRNVLNKKHWSPIWRSVLLASFPAAFIGIILNGDFIYYTRNTYEYWPDDGIFLTSFLVATAVIFVPIAIALYNNKKHKGWIVTFAFLSFVPILYVASLIWAIFAPKQPTGENPKRSINWDSLDDDD